MMTATESAAGRAGDDRDMLATVAPIRLLVVDDHPAVRRGLSELLEDQPDFRVIAAVGTAEDAMTVAEREVFDVAVVDYQLPGRNGLWVSRKLKRLPHPPRVLIYSAYYDGVLAASAVVAEADGLVSKGGLGQSCAKRFARSQVDGRRSPWFHGSWPRRCAGAWRTRNRPSSG